MAEAASHCAVTLRQGENAHRLEISFTDNGLPYRISGECYAVFAAKKSDGTQLLNDCTIVNDTVIYELTAQTTAAPGKLSCEVRLYGETDKLIIAPKFSIFVEDSTIDESGVESSDEFSALNALISRSSSVAVFRLKGYFDSEEELAQLSAPTVGDAYGIGIRAPYEIYVWDAVNGEWVNHGILQGEPGQDGAPGTPGQPGEQGEQGVSGVYVGSGTAPESYNVQIDPEGNADELITEAPKDGKRYARKNGDWAEVEGGGGSSDELWRPTVDSAGNLSWEKSSVSTAPTTQNIKGPQGIPGEQGIQGAQGIQGPPGQDGSDAEVTKENIVSALGYTPADEDKLALTNQKLRALSLIARGQGWDTANGTSPAYTQTVPAGAEAVSVNSIGGKSEAVDGEIISAEVTEIESVGKNLINPEFIVVTRTNIRANSSYDSKPGLKLTGGQTYTLSYAGDSTPNQLSVLNHDNRSERLAVKYTTKSLTFTPETDVTAEFDIYYVDGLPDEEHKVMVEKGASATTYAPYFSDMLSIPAALLTFLADKGYGQSPVGGAGNTLDLENRKYTQVGSYVNGVWTALSEPVEYDISDYLEDGFGLLPAESGGSLTFVQTDTQLPVPNDTEYAIKLSEVLT